MSTPAQITKNASRRRWRLYLIVAVVLLVLIGAGIWAMGRFGSSHVEPPPPTSPPEAGSESSEGAYELVPGRDQVGQHPVGFPHTPEGAVAAAVYGVQAESTNDAEALLQVRNLYHRREHDLAYVEDFLLAGRALDLRLAQPEDGDFETEDFPTPGSYFYVTVWGVRWEAEDADTVVVALLAGKEMSDGGSVVIEDRYIYGRTMVWDENVRGGDWVVEEITDPVLSGGKPSAEQYELDYPGWVRLVNPDEGT